LRYTTTMFLRRTILAVYDVLATLLVACVFSCAFVGTAFAYIDPSVMTYTIQAVAGVAVALSTVLGVALRRGRRSMLRLLDIDENAHRETEPNVCRCENGEPVGVVQAAEPSAPATDGTALSDAVEAASAADADTGKPEQPAAPAEPAKPAKKKRFPFSDMRPYAPTWRQRLLLAFLASFFAVYTIYVVAPYEVIGSAAGSLVYTLGDVWWVIWPPALGVIAVLTLVLTLLRGKAFNIGLVLVATIGLCAYVQALVLNYGLPVADGGTIIWADHMVMQVVSTLVWVAIIVLAIVGCACNRRRAQGVVAIVSVFLILVQTVGVASLFIAPPAATEEAAGLDALNTNLVSKTEIVMTEDQLYTVNPNKNVVVFVLDTYDTAYLSRNLDMNPHLLDGLTGFTNYENCTGGMIPTRFAIPQMLTGQMMRGDENFSTYKNERYARSSFLQDIYDANYSIGLYTDSLTIAHLPESEQREITDKTVNMHRLPVDTMSYEGVLEAYWYMGMYRDVPWPFKWMFWYYTDEINAMMVVYDPEASPDEIIYVMDDIRYYNRLCSIRLSLEEDSSYDGGFRFIHLLGAHYPFSYDEEVNDLGTDNSNVFKQSQGAIRIVQEYCDQLKELGVYDQTTIIVTADHGYWTLTMDPIEETSTPIMFVKPAQSAELDAQPIKVDEKPVSHFDLQATVLDAMGLDYSEYTNRDEFEGYSMFRDIDPDRVRLYVTTDSEGLQEMQFREYVIDGNALDFDNWSETGRTWDALQ